MLTPTHSDLLYEAAHIANAEEIPRHPPHYRTWILSLLRGLILSDIEQGRFSEDTVTAARAFLRIIATEIFEQSRRNGISTPPDGVQGYLSTSTANPTISGTSANLEGSLQRQGSTPESGSSMPTRRATLFNEPDVSNYSSEHLNTLINLFNSIVLMELGTDIPEFHFVFAVREALTQLGRYRLRLNESEPGQDLARNVLALDPVDPNEMDPQAPEMEPSQLDGTSDNLNIGSESQPEDGSDLNRIMNAMNRLNGNRIEGLPGNSDIRESFGNSAYSTPSTTISIRDSTAPRTDNHWSVAIPARNRDLWTEVPTIFRRQAVEESVAPTEDLAWGPLGTDWSTLRGPGVRPRQLLSRTEWDTPNGSESSRFEESFGIPENTQNYHTFPTQDRPSPTNVTTHPRINEDDEPFDHGDAPLSESRHDDMAEFLTAVPTNTPYSNSLRGDVDVEEISDIQQSSNSTISAPFFEYIERATVEGISEVQQIDNEISDRLTELKLLSNTSITNLILTVVGNPDLHLTHGSIKGENATALERSEVGLGRQTSHFLPVQSDDHNDESGANTEVEVSVPEDADNQALPSPISTGNIESGGEGKYGFVPADLFRQLAYRHFLDLQLIMVVDNIEPVELYKYLRFQSRAHPARTARLYSYWATVMVFRSMLEDDIESLFNQWPQDLQDEETQWISNLQELGVHLRGNSMPSLTLEYERQMGLQIPLDLDLICLIDIKTPFEVYNILCRDNRPRAEKGVWEIMRQFTKQQQDFYIETQNVYGEVLGSPDLSSSEKGPLLAFPNYSLRIERLSRHSIPSNLGIQFLKKLQESDVFSTSRMVEEGVKFVDIFAFLRSICRAYPLFTKFEEAAAAIYGRISHEDELAYITGLPRDVQGTELEWLNNLIHGAPLSKKKVPSGLRFGLEFEYREVVLDDMDDARYPMGKAVSAMLNILSPEVPLVAVVKAARRSIEVIVSIEISGYMQDALLQNTDVMQKIVRWYAEGGWMTSVEAQQCAFDRILEEAGRGTGGEEVELEDSGMARYVWFR